MLGILLVLCILYVLYIVGLYNNCTLWILYCSYVFPPQSSLATRTWSHWNCWSQITIAYGALRYSAMPMDPVFSQHVPLLYPLILFTWTLYTFVSLLFLPSLPSSFFCLFSSHPLSSQSANILARQTNECRQCCRKHVKIMIIFLIIMVLIVVSVTTPPAVYSPAR